MQTSILPEVGSLTTVSASEVDTHLPGGPDRPREPGSLVVIVVGVLLVAAAVALQLYLAARCRRMVNPALVAATLIAIALVAVTVAQLSAKAGHLRVAKQEAFDSIIALTQARAVSYDANADESRYLVDPGRAAQYQQAFLVKSEQIADVGPVGIFGYDAALAADIRAYTGDNSDVRFGGYLGAEFRNITFPGERAAAVAHAARLPGLRAGRPGAARAGEEQPAGRGRVRHRHRRRPVRLGVQSATTLPCRRSSRSTRRAFTAAVADGQGGARLGRRVPGGGRPWSSPLLVLAGVRPRLAEYR